MKLKAYVVNAEEPGQWITIAPIEFEKFIVPTFIRTDGASIPWAFQWLVKKGGNVFPCAILHDYLYHYQIVKRKEADDAFLRAMEANGVPKWKRLLMYWAVRAWGWIPYGSYGKRSRRTV